jgi:hypothetical protein
MNNSELTHKWAHDKTLHRSGSHLHARGDTLVSYSTSIARHMRDGVVLLNEKTYSTTTTRHQSYARRATTHLTQVMVPNDDALIGPFNKAWARGIIKWYHDKARAAMEKQNRARSSIWNAAEANRRLDQAAMLALIFKIKLPDDTVIKEKLAAESARIEAARVKSEARIKAAFAKLLPAWKKCKKNVRLPCNGPITYVRRNGDNVETSKGIVLPFVVAKRYFDQAKAGNPPKDVAGYHVDDVNSKTVRIGCHTILWSELEEIFT